jgi:hypothetical protein
MKKILFGFILTSFLALGITGTAIAQKNYFGIKPEDPNKSYFDFTLNPGESVQDAIVASNESGEDIYMKLEAVDATTADNGGIAYDFANPTTHSQWLTMEKPTNPLLVKPFHVIRIPFTVSVPANTPPGEYVIGFLATKDLSQVGTPTVNPNSNFSIVVVQQVAVSVVIHVPGAQKCSIKVNEITPLIQNGKWDIKAVLKNDGNIHFNGKGKIVLMDANQNVLSDTPIATGYFVSGTEMEIDTLIDLPEVGKYTLQYSLTDQKDSACMLDNTQPIEFGVEDQKASEQQATRIAGAVQLATREATRTAAKNATQVPVNTPSSPYYLLWISGIILLLSAGLVVFALSSLKKRK